ncbi:nuclear transport factor 2 family protein [Arsukibacterium perlucidum]|uniref:nuclear transport factor 2 family protein n=1 Tax=Arsukibacterium perlucidum TaxID=368811 RepID=UPI00036E0C17|nr:nuclear transport factor 2 family protein [Arsukibacterium perlucidum]
MKTSLLLATLVLTSALLTPTFAIADDKAELTALLSEFLDGATRNDPAIHNKYWADELIYTSSAGTRFGKAELMQSVNSRGELKADEIGMRYSSEDVQILQYGDTAVVAFTLVATSDTETLRFLNSGTFIRKNGNWQAVNWQATRKAE